jgi:hypothetical protein
MSNELMKLAQSVMSMRQVVPAKTFEISKRFYVDFGFQPQPLTDSLVGTAVLQRACSCAL